MADNSKLDSVVAHLVNVLHDTPEFIDYCEEYAEDALSEAGLTYDPETGQGLDEYAAFKNEAEQHILAALHASPLWNVGRNKQEEADMITALLAGISIETRKAIQADLKESQWDLLASNGFDQQDRDVYEAWEAILERIRGEDPESDRMRRILGE